MRETELKILLVEDSPPEVELTLRALRHNNLANRIHVARDGGLGVHFLAWSLQRPGFHESAQTDLVGFGTAKGPRTGSATHYQDG